MGLRKIFENFFEGMGSLLDPGLPYHVIKGIPHNDKNIVRKEIIVSQDQFKEYQEMKKLAQKMGDYHVEAFFIKDSPESETGRTSFGLVHNDPNHGWATEQDVRAAIAKANRPKL